MRCAGEDLRAVWKDRIDNPKTGRAIGSGPFLVERWERNKQLTLIRNPRYWGPHRLYLDRIVLRFCRRLWATPTAEVLDALRQGTVDSAHRGTPRSSRASPDFGSQGPSRRRRRLGAPCPPGRAGGHPALRKKLVRRALAYGIDRVAIARQLFGEIDPKFGRATAPSPEHQSFLQAQLEAATATVPVAVPAAARASGLQAAAPTASTSATAEALAPLLTLAGAPLRQRGLELDPVPASAGRASRSSRSLLRSAGSLFEQILPSGGFDGALFSWFGSSFALAGKNLFGCGGDPELDGYASAWSPRTSTRLVGSSTQAQRGRVLNRVDRQMAKDVP